MKRIRPADGVILLLCLALAAASFFVFVRQKEPLTARIYDGGAQVKTVDLTAVKTPETFTLSSGVVVEIFPGGARFVASPCKGQDCVHAGALTRAGMTAACAPNRAAIVLTGQNTRTPDAPDAVSY